MAPLLKPDTPQTAVSAEIPATESQAVSLSSQTLDSGTLVTQHASGLNISYIFGLCLQKPPVSVCTYNSCFYWLSVSRDPSFTC